MNEACLRKTLAEVKQVLLSIIGIATEEYLDVSSKLARIALEAQRVVLIIEEIESIMEN